MPDAFSAASTPIFAAEMRQPGGFVRVVDREVDDALDAGWHACAVMAISASLDLGLADRVEQEHAFDPVEDLPHRRRLEQIALDGR